MIATHMPPAKQAILNESLKLFASRGVDAVTVRDIAAATGYSNPALFRHYASKEALAADLFASCYRRLVDALLAAARAHDHEAWLAAALGEVAAGPERVLFVVDNLRRYFDTLPADLRAHNLPSLTRAMIEREKKAGRFAADLDVGLAVTVVLGTLGQIARSAHFHGSRVDTRTASRLAHLLSHGFRASTPRRA